MASRFASQIEQALRALGAAPGERLLVAVSGGGDSVALLYALSERKRWPLVAAHIVHGLRPGEDETRLVAAHAAACGASFRSATVDAGGLAQERGAGLEEAARVARYQALSQLAREEGARAILTGHSQDDQAETVLWRILRGAALPGLSGIAPRLLLADGTEVLRPMVGSARAAAREYLSTRGIQSFEDPSNQDPRFTRNRLRAVIPQLEEESPALRAHLAALAEEVSGWRALVEEQVRVAFAAHGARHPEEVWFAARFLAAGGALATEVIRYGLRQLGPLPSRGQLDAISRLARGPNQRQVQLSRGRWARRDGAWVIVRWGSPGEELP